MRYSTPTLFLKYLHYYWVASNSKGHGIHSPFVFKFIREVLNASSSLKEIENNAPATNKMLEEIEAASTNKFTPKIKLLIARLIQSLNPLTVSVTEDKKQFEANRSNNTNETMELNESVDFAFISEGQDVDTMLRNVNKLIDNMHSNSFVILHGIHTDSNMEAAWDQLKKHTTIRLSIDLFAIGILFCRKEQKEQEHFIIRY